MKMSRPSGAGVSGWARRWWRALLAELLSTALLVELGCASCVPLGAATTVGDVTLPPAATSQPALAFGFVVTANMLAFGATSGAHMNPAVTLGAVLYGQLEPLAALGYVLAQCAGAVLGFGGLLAAVPTGRTGGLCVTSPARGVTPLGAVFLEVCITGVLVLAICELWASNDQTRPNHSAPISIGLVVAGLCYAMGAATGASLNPARSFGPAVLHGFWQDHWVYWAGPMLGGAMAALLHRYVLAPTVTRRGTPQREVTPSDTP